jgi:hypothetical protein
MSQNAPKTRNNSAAPASTPTVGDISAISTSTSLRLEQKLDELTRTLADYSARFDKLESLLTITRQENKELKATVMEQDKSLQDRDKEIDQLKQRLNTQEQYQRGWSIRILNLRIPSFEANCPEAVMRHVHHDVLEPIFQGALAKGLIHSIPAVETVLETAHILPAKGDAIPPIIARFYTRNIKSLLFRLKKEFAVRETNRAPATAPSAATNRPSLGKLRHPFYEDLTRHNFSKLRAISQHERVESAWSVSGTIRYRLKNEILVRKVKSVFASVEDIINKGA